VLFGFRILSISVLLKELAEIRNIYRRSGSAQVAKAVYAKHKIREYWYVWFATAFYVIAAIPIAFCSDACFWLGILATIFAFSFLFFAVEHVVQQEFSEEYASHGLADHPYGLRRFYLRYAIFFKEIIKNDWNAGQIRQILDLYQISERPSAPFRLIEHPAVVPGITVLTVLFAEYIQDTDVWKAGNGYIFLFLIFMGVVFLGYA